MNKFEIILKIMENGTQNRGRRKEWEKLIEIVCKIELGEKIKDDRFIVRTEKERIQDDDYIWDSINNKWQLITKDHILYDRMVENYKIRYKNYFSDFDRLNKKLKKYGINLEDYIKNE